MKISHSISCNDVLEIVIDNQSKKNAIDDEMIHYIVDNIKKNSRLTIIRSIGRFFCAGRDVSAINPEDANSMQALEHLALAFHEAVQPVLTVIEGRAIGLGVSMACWSDVCLASTEATFMVPEAKIGIAPTITANSLLETVGRKRCLDMCLTAREINAEQAHDYGIVQYVSTPDQLEDVKNDITNRILCAAPEAISISKSLINKLDEEAFRRNLGLSGQHALMSARSPSVGEGLKAFREKTQPSWVMKEPPK